MHLKYSFCCQITRCGVGNLCVLLVIHATANELIWHKFRTELTQLTSTLERVDGMKKCRKFIGTNNTYSKAML